MATFTVAMAAQCSSSAGAVAGQLGTAKVQLQADQSSAVRMPFVSKSSTSLRSGSSRSITRLAAAHSGLGASLPEGYEVKDRVVVDDDHAADPAASGNVIQKLLSGFKNFKEAKFKQNPAIFDPLKEGQAPEVMIIACADSRVCPTMLHGLEPGEAFIVRSVANLVPEYDPKFENVHHGTSAAVQYAVTALGVKKVIVMGHSSCGGIKALMTMDDFDSDFVGSWVKIGLPAKKTTLSQMGSKPLAEQCTFCEQEAVNVSLRNLISFPFVEERVKNGELELFGMHYDFHDGKLTSWKAAPAMATAKA